MNKIQESLEANKAEILKAIPDEFKADFEAQISAAANAPAPLTGDDAVKAVQAELKSNPAVDESAASAELSQISVPEPSTTVLTGDAAVAAIKAELRENPAVDEKEAAAELTNIKPPEAQSRFFSIEEHISLLSQQNAICISKNSFCKTLKY